jgi:polysaccharide export outer membrane protein
MGIKWIRSLAAAAVFCAAAAHAAAGTIDASAADPVQAGDKLNIIVYREPELSGVFTVNSVGFTVDSEGKIDYPLLGKLQVAGLTPQQLSRELADQLKGGYVVDPQVRVSFHEQKMIKEVVILGQVVKSGAYKHTPDMTLAKLISAAGGFIQPAGAGRSELAPSADAERIRITRGQPGAETSFVVNAAMIINGTASDVPLLAGDRVFVPQRETELKVGVLGQVQAPGNYDWTSGMTVVRLVTEARGFTRFADMKKIVLTPAAAGPGGARVVDAEAIMYGKRADVPLEAGDSVFVPESAF